ncbi:putative transcription factor interactor and regulator CCHC(Zn) family [Rosa chinensis]|uniref:Putative transcription factor interactor and regulator CCHC(Zn) family n=1 Tax=Rosa chinensis TaxID=74649 RepID=A0A2P6PDC1_ROSCH|nr:putative transcription factor interactor and regulator CCHC(Zn) family [Rosa chinensis]
MNNLRVEEKQRVDQKEKPEKTPIVNLVVGNKNHNKTKFHNRNRRSNFQPRGINFKNNRANHNKQFQKSRDQGREKISCFVCGRTNHVARNCFYKRTEENKSQANRNGPKAQVNMLMEQESSQPLFKNQVEDV